MGVTVKKCHMIMSGNDCWNSVCFSCCRKVDNELADVTLSGRLFQNCAAATGNARPPMVDSLSQQSMSVICSKKSDDTVGKIPLLKWDSTQH